MRGGFLFVKGGRADDLSITVRTRETSRLGDTWGTSVPVIRPRNLFGREFGLLDIPTNAQFRSTLRIYDADAETDPRVRVRVYRINPGGVDPITGINGDTLLLELEPAFDMPEPGTRSNTPASSEIALWLRPELVNVGRIRVEIEPLDGQTDYWGFVSVTHNTTQYVTIVTPRQ